MHFYIFDLKKSRLSWGGSKIIHNCFVPNVVFFGRVCFWSRLYAQFFPPLVINIIGQGLRIKRGDRVQCLIQLIFMR